MATNLRGTKIAFLVANEAIEQVELTEPWKTVVLCGAPSRDEGVTSGKRDT
jgi:protease I